MLGNFMTYRNGLWFKVAIVSTCLLTISYVVYSSYTTPHGGTVIGLCYGVIGLLAILLLMFYGIRKRHYQSNSGSLQAWLSSHVYIGLLTLLVIPMHAGFRFGFDIHTLAFVLLVLVVLSGMAGTYLYLSLPRRFQQFGAELAYEGIDGEFHKIIKQMRSLCTDKSDAFVQKCETEIERGTPRKHIAWQLLLQPQPAHAAASQDMHDFHTYMERLPENEHNDFQRLAVLTTQKHELQNRLVCQMRLKNLLEVWLYIHLPVSIAMLAAVLLHLLLVLYF